MYAKRTIDEIRDKRYGYVDNIRLVPMQIRVMKIKGIWNIVKQWHQRNLNYLIVQRVAPMIILV